MAKFRLVRVDVRLEEEIYEGVRRLAEKADVSMNELMHGLAVMAVKYGHAGEADLESPELVTRARQGCLWFGRELGEFPENPAEGVFFSLDYSGRRVLGGGVGKGKPEGKAKR